MSWILLLVARIIPPHRGGGGNKCTIRIEGLRNKNIRGASIRDPIPFFCEAKAEPANVMELELPQMLKMRARISGFAVPRPCNLAASQNLTLTVSNSKGPENNCPYYEGPIGIIAEPSEKGDARSPSEVSTGRRGDRKKRRAKRETGERDISGSSW